MAGRGSTTFKKRQKEQKRQEKREEKFAKRLARKENKPSEEEEVLVPFTAETAPQVHLTDTE